MLSGSCNGVGEKSRGRFRPRGPSGDDCSEMVEGLAVDEVPLGVNALAGVTVNGTEVLIWCLVMRVDRDDGDGDGQHPLPFVMVGDEVAAEGDILKDLGEGTTGPLRTRFADVSSVSEIVLVNVLVVRLW